MRRLVAVSHDKDVVSAAEGVLEDGAGNQEHLRVMACTHVISILLKETCEKQIRNYILLQGTWGKQIHNDILLQGTWGKQICNDILLQGTRGTQIRNAILLQGRSTEKRGNMEIWRKRGMDLKSQNVLKEGFPQKHNKWQEAGTADS